MIVRTFTDMYVKGKRTFSMKGLLDSFDNQKVLGKFTRDQIKEVCEEHIDRRGYDNFLMLHAD